MNVFRVQVAVVPELDGGRPWKAPLLTAFAAHVFFDDLRLDARLGSTFNEMARRPEGTLPKKLVKRAALKGGYRLLNHADVTHQRIIRAHQARCLEHLEGFTGTALLLHDTTVDDLSGLDVQGLGQVGDGHGKGLYLHNSLLILPQTRQVVGLMNQIVHQRRHVPAKESKSQRQKHPDRESRLWKQAVADLPPMPPGVRLIDVSDAGSDITEYIDHEVQAGRQFIVRSQHNRKLINDRGQSLVRKLHERMRLLPAMEQYTIRVPAQNGGWREAVISLSWEKLNILPPRQPRGEHGSEAIELYGVIARELSPVDGEEPIEWILLTNLPVTNAEQAREVVKFYGCRWMVEDYHKAMKTGCGLEETQLTTRHALDNLIAIVSVLAVHVLRLRCNARNPEIAQQPARLHEEELKVKLVAKDAKHADWRQMTAFEFYVAVARMGGYQLNPHQRPPGWIVLWRGYVRLENMCDGVRLMNERCG